MLSSVFAAAVAACIAMPQSASAAAHPRVQPLDCTRLVGKASPNRIWQAEFYGSRGGYGTWDMYQQFYLAPCFSSQATCVDWLYWAQSDWPNENRVGRCRQGTPYSR